MVYTHRTLEKVIAHASTRFKAVLVSGMRQAGKQTLLSNIPGVERPSVSLEELVPQRIAATARDTFFEQYPAPITIREIQRVPALCLTIKSLLDDSDKRGRIWLTASQRLDMVKDLPESLAGRLAWFDLLPFSIYERQNKAFEQQPYLPKAELTHGTLAARSVNETWETIWQGAWQGISYDSPEGRDTFFNDLVRNRMAGDLIHAGIRHLEKFFSFLTVLASHVGQEFQLNAVAAESDISMPTAKLWLSVARSCGVIYLLEPFPEKIGRPIIKKPKLYFTDTGLAAWLCSIPSPEVLRLTKGESFFENFVIIEILKSWLHNGRRPLFYHYRDSKFNEINLLIREGTQYHPISIKTTNNPDASMVKVFDNIKGSHFTRGSGALICLTEEPQFLTGDIVAHNIWDI